MRTFFKYFINGLLVIVIVGIIIATWMPAIYSSEWFHKTFPKWVDSPAAK